MIINSTTVVLVWGLKAVLTLIGAVPHGGEDSFATGLTVTLNRPSC